MENKTHSIKALEDKLKQLEIESSQKVEFTKWVAIRSRINALKIKLNHMKGIEFSIPFYSGNVLYNNLNKN